MLFLHIASILSHSKRRCYGQEQMQRETWLVEHCFCDKPKVVTSSVRIVPLESHTSPLQHAQLVLQHCSLPLSTIPCAQMRPPVYKKVGLLFLARRWILVRQFLETFETLKLHQTLPLHGTVVPVNVSASGIHVIIDRSYDLG